MHTKVVVLIATAIWMLPIGAFAATSAPPPPTSSVTTAVATKLLNLPGCVAGQNRTFTFAGKLAGFFSPASVDSPKAEYAMYLWLKKPTSVCGYHAFGIKQTAYKDVKAIGFGIYSVANYHAIMKRWGGRQILMTGDLWNTELTMHGGGPVIFFQVKTFCYNMKNSKAVFLCFPWDNGEGILNNL